MTNPKRGKTAQASSQKFEPREVKRVDGWEDSEGKVHDHPVKAAAVQAELDLLRLVYHHIDVDEAFDGDMSLAKKSICNMFREHRDLFIHFLKHAYMTPDELGEAMDRYENRNNVTTEQAPPLAPAYESKAKEILKHAFDKGWERRGDYSNNDNAPDKDVAFDKYWMHRTSKELRYLLPPTTQLFTEFNAKFAFEAGWVKGRIVTCSIDAAFKDWWNEMQPKDKRQ